MRQPCFFLSPVRGPLAFPREEPRMTPVSTSGGGCETAGHAHQITRGCPAVADTPEKELPSCSVSGPSAPHRSVCDSSLKAPSRSSSFTPRRVSASHASGAGQSLTHVTCGPLQHLCIRNNNTSIMRMMVALRVVLLQSRTPTDRRNVIVYEASNKVNS